MSGLRDFGSILKGKLGLVGGCYYLRAALTAPSAAIINAIDVGYEW